MKKTKGPTKEEKQWVEKHGLEWSVNTPSLLGEILNNDSTWVLLKPLQIFGLILAEVGDRCAEINDPVLNHLMCRLAIYAEADQYNSDYNKEMVNKAAKNYRQYMRQKEKGKL